MFTTSTYSPFRRAHALVAATFGVALALIPAAAHAQQAIPGVVVAAKQDVARAAQLEAEALREEASPKRWRDAAGLYRRAAELQGSTPEAASLYRRSAWLYSAVGDYAKGRQQLERSARIALDRGDVVLAANTLYDAALMAATGRDVRATDETVQRLQVLLAAPLMPEEVRDGLKERLGAPARLARR